MYELREQVVDLVEAAALLPCACRPGHACLRCRAMALRREIATGWVRVKRWRNDGPTTFVAVEHTAGPVLASRETHPTYGPGYISDRRQTCTDCGQQLARGKWDRYSAPGQAVWALHRHDGRPLWPDPVHSAGFRATADVDANPDVAVRITCSELPGYVRSNMSEVSHSPVTSRTMNLIALLRVSTRGQADDGFGLAAQEKTIRDWARAHHHRIGRVIAEEGVKGDIPLTERTQLLEAVALVAAGRHDGIVVARLDRLARDLVVQEQLIAELARLGKPLRSASPGEDVNLLDADPQRVLVRQIMGAIAAYERAMIRMRTTHGLEIKKAAGGYAGGRPPYGWAAIGGDLRVVPAEQTIRKCIKDWRRQGWTYRKIADRLNANGHRSKDGREWRAESVARVVRNNTYALDSPNTRRSKKPAPQTPDREAV